MNCKLGLLCGTALIAFAPLAANAQDATSTTTTTTTTATTNMSGDMSTTPMPITGTVLRYYVDRTGYVSAMDVQTAEGVQMVRFSPSMGQRLYSTYGVGSTANLYVMGSPAAGWSAVGMGTVAPTISAPPMVSDLDLLDSAPYISAGAKMIQVDGSLTDMIVNPTGEIVGLVLDNTTLVRVPREVRNIAPGAAGTDRVTPLFKGADVNVTGYAEAPRYGVVSSFTNRIAANALVINGRAVGAIGVPMMSREQSRSLVNVNIGGTDRTAEEMRAMGMGYTVYSPSASTMQNGTMMDTNATSTSTDTNTAGGTTTTTTPMQ